MNKNHTEIIDHVSTDLANKSLAIIKGLLQRKLKTFTKKGLTNLTDVITQSTYVKVGELIALTLESDQALKNTRK